MSIGNRHDFFRAAFACAGAIDLTAFLAGSDHPSTPANALDLILAHRAMPAAMTQILVNAVAADSDGALHQVQTGIHLMMTDYCKVWN